MMYLAQNWHNVLTEMPPIKSLLLSALIRDEARRLGFFKVGFAPATVLPTADKFMSCLAQGLHGEMAYIERQAAKREDPRLVFPSARSILVAAMNYCTGDTLSDDPLKGRISRYAWGDDYHATVMARLKRLLEFIRSRESSAEGLCYVDTGPVMEKVWGTQTAIGWMGKHTNLIARDQGSWFFLGTILLNLELEYDCKEKDFCGKCTRCIHACPTGAIAAPYVLDSRCCISYLTIELRGPIPRHLRSLIGNRIYGCDDCQEVCPWNRFAVKTSEREFYPRDGNFMPELRQLISMSHEQFRYQFNNSPMRRVKRDGFVRNVVVALGNSRRREAVPALGAALQDESPLVRSHAAWGLGQIQDREAISLLESSRRKETATDVLEEIDLAMGK
jgi:epoxyqueuosine reductase